MEPHHHHHQLHPSIVVYDAAEPNITYHASAVTGSACCGSVPVYAGTKRINYAAVEFAGGANKEAMTRLQIECHRNDLLAEEHPNVVGVTKHFTYDGFFCAVLPRFNGSLREAFDRSRQGRSGTDDSEYYSILALKQVLRGLSFIHGRGHIHGKIDADHVYWNYHNNGEDRPREIKLGYAASICDFNTERGSGGGDGSIYLPGDERLTPKSDMWSVGLMALELAYDVDLRSFKERRVLDALLKRINKSKWLPSKERMNYYTMKSGRGGGGGLLGIIGRRRSRRNGDISGFSMSFCRMIARCIDSDPLKRPTADQLLNADLFKLYNEFDDLFDMFAR